MSAAVKLRDDVCADELCVMAREIYCAWRRSTAARRQARGNFVGFCALAVSPSRGSPPRRARRRVKTDGETEYRPRTAGE